MYSSGVGKKTNDQQMIMKGKQSENETVKLERVSLKQEGTSTTNGQK